MEEFSDLEENEEDKEVGNASQSVLSTETEKRGAEFKLKVENYLEQNRNSIPLNLDRGRLDDDQKDGKLIDELNNIG